MSTLIPIIVGFLLTSVLGGILGSLLQQRTWDHQRKAALSDRELNAADSVCRDVSKLLDKRLYRMLRLYYALRFAKTADSAEAKEVARVRLRDYDSLLYEWNDQLNLNLALIGSYFGQGARDLLHYEIYEPCQSVGSELEVFYRHVMNGAPLALNTDDIEFHLSALNEQVYRLGVFMMTQLRGGYVGRSAPQPVLRETSPELVKDPPVTLPGIAPHNKLIANQSQSSAGPST
jgi:hypothetical protein